MVSWQLLTTPSFEHAHRQWVEKLSWQVLAATLLALVNGLAVVEVVVVVVLALGLEHSCEQATPPHVHMPAAAGAKATRNRMARVMGQQESEQAMLVSE